MILGVEEWQHTLVLGFSGVSETAPHITCLVDAVLWRQRQGLPALGTERRVPQAWK